MLARGELVALLQRCVEILQPSKSKKMKNALVQLEELLSKFKQLDSKILFSVSRIPGDTAVEERGQRSFNEQAPDTCL